MSIAVVDYAFTHPTIAQLKAQGIKSVGRYFGQGSPPKNLTKTEAELLSENGISIFSIFEFEANQVLGGLAQAEKDVALARVQKVAVGMPANRPFYFAADFDIRDFAPSSTDPKAKLGPAGAYFQYVHDQMGTNAGAYGGFWLIKRLFDAKLITWGFQTIAWSGGHWDPRAQIRQTGAGDFGTAADVDVPERTDYGQWRVGQTFPATVIAKPHPPTVPVPTAPLVAVPNLNGKRVNDAIAVLEKLGLNYHVATRDPKSAYEVNSQTPGQGDHVARGTVIRLGIKKL
jgi:hypothetical protein